jgi:hypothetical protein
MIPHLGVYYMVDSPPQAVIMFLGLKVEQWLAFTAIAAVISMVGALLGIVLKDYFFSRAFENWKQQRTLEQLYQKFRDPLLLSSRELCARVIEILDQYPTVYLQQSVLVSRPERQIENSINDPYFQRYKLVSTAYRICSFLGWLELYRQEIVFLRPGNNKHARRLEGCLAHIRADLADGQLNTADDWMQWRDTLVFREELRAIGEAMIETRGAARAVMGYASFCEVFESKAASRGAKRWISVVLNFVLDLEVARKDFRKRRLERLVVHLVDLLIELDNESPEPFFVSARTKYAHMVGKTGTCV